MGFIIVLLRIFLISLLFHKPSFRMCLLCNYFNLSGTVLILKKNGQVVEASQDFVPLLLLTADRPAELQDAGANQAINQV